MTVRSGLGELCDQRDETPRTKYSESATRGKEGALEIETLSGPWTNIVVNAQWFSLVWQPSDWREAAHQIVPKNSIL